MTMAHTHSPDDKIYPAGEDLYSIHDILSIATNPEYLGADGFPRISDFHLKVGMPLRVRMDHQLLDLSGG